MAKQSKKSTRGQSLGGSKKTAPVAKTAKTVSPAKPKTDKVATAAVGKYGAPSVRPNRDSKVAPSVLGNRKWNFRGVTEVNGSGMFTATDELQCRKFPKAEAERVLAKCLEHRDIVNGRLFYAAPDEKGNPIRSVWIAFVGDNGDYRKAA